MDGPLPDHYKALGVDKNADAATIKSTYRKLVLKCHPDKVADPAQREDATARFHSIQQAYETLVDDEKRSDYEAHLTLERLRREKAARANASAPRGERSARFEQPTPGGATHKASTTPRHGYSTEERRPSHQYDDDHYQDNRKRDKYDTYDAYPKPTTSSRSRSEKESSSKSSKPAASDRTRSDRDKTRAKDLRSDRKFAQPESESSSDEKVRYETAYKRRSQEDEARKQAEASRRKAEDRRSYEERDRYPSKSSDQLEEALRYQHKTRERVQEEIRPSPVRTSARDYYAPEHRSSHRTSQREPARPETVRRSSAQPKRQSSTSRRESDRGIPEIVDWGEDTRRPPTFKHSSSSPANIEVPSRSIPVRSYTDSSRRAERSPPPSMHRSSTMPIGGLPHTSAPRRKDTAPVRPSTLRETVTPEHHSPERDAYPSVPVAQPSAGKTTYYSYKPGAGVSLRPEDAASPSSKPRTILREPGRHHRSPSPLGRPPMGPNVQEAAKYTTKPTAPRPSMARTDSNRNYSPTREDRGRSARPKLYGEVGGENHGRGRQASYNPADVQYSQKYGPEDVNWAPKNRENDREYASKPTLGRTVTYVY
ncbi:hypothetical protein ACN47E_001663 [Coniothyrium glycines]